MDLEDHQECKVQIQNESKVFKVINDFQTNFIEGIKEFKIKKKSIDRFRELLRV